MSFSIDFLDHVAIMVADVNASADWYEKVLGLKRYQLPEWGEYPAFMLANKAGVALFPVDSSNNNSYKNRIRIDHFAFNVTNENFEKAKQQYEKLGLQFQIQDHHYFHSIYTKDLDGHVVELTTLVVEEKDFYKIKPSK